MSAGVVPSSEYLIESRVLDSTVGSVVFNNLDQFAGIYKHLQFIVVARKSNADVSGSVNSRINGVTSGYSQHALRATGSVVNSFGESNTIAGFNFYIPAANATANAFGAGVVDILDPFNTTKNTTVRTLGGGTPSNFITLASFAFNSTAMVTSYSFEALENGFVAGSRFSLYGVTA
jgi:hypothetical protein